MNDQTARRNIKLVIAYNGTAYHGWQRQKEPFDTVKLRIEQAAVTVMKHPVSVRGAGRTDAGVHASGQVANFYSTNFSVPLFGLRRAMNSRLPKDIAVVSAEHVPESFHASLSAIGKTYRYRIWTSPVKPVELAGQVYHYWRTLDADAMRLGAVRLVGTHDFRGLATSGEKRDNTVRTIYRCDVAEEGGQIIITTQGNGFLYNMVRNIVGTLLEVGRGKRKPADMKAILKAKSRCFSGNTAPARPLHPTACRWSACITPTRCSGQAGAGGKGGRGEEAIDSVSFSAPASPAACKALSSVARGGGGLAFVDHFLGEVSDSTGFLERTG